MNKVFLILRRKKKVVMLSLLNVCILTILSYILNNQSVFTGEDLNKFAWIQLLKNKIGIEKENEKENVLFINVSYDKQLTDFYDQYGMCIGNIDITDRSKLLRFLQVLHATNQYAYVFLDIRFEKDYYVPEVDSLLYEEIKNMDNIVVAHHANIAVADSTISSKIAVSDYDATIVATNFARYRYLTEGTPSVPLYAFQEITQKRISKHGFIYTCDGKLCYNSLFVDFPVEDFEEFDGANKKIYYNLGSDLLENYSNDDIATLTKKKFVVIGNFVDDMHDTYSGLKPGPIITFYSFRSLMEGKHFLNYWITILMAVIFFTISVNQFSHRSLFERIPVIRKSKSKLLHFSLSLVEYSTFLTVIVFLLDIFFGISSSILLPSVYFSIQKIIINHNRYKV